MQVPPWPRNSDAQNLQKLMDPTSVASTKPQPMAPLCVMRSTKEVRRTMNQSGNRKKNPGKMGRLSRGTPACPACLYMGSNGENGNKIKEKHHTISEGGSSILLGPPADTGPCTCLLALFPPEETLQCVFVRTRIYWPTFCLLPGHSGSLWTRIVGQGDGCEGTAKATKPRGAYKEASGGHAMDSGSPTFGPNMKYKHMQRGRCPSVRGTEGGAGVRHQRRV